MRAVCALFACVLFAACAPAERVALNDNVENTDLTKEGPEAVSAVGGYLSGEIHGTVLADASVATLNETYSFVELNLERPDRAFMVRIFFPVHVNDYLTASANGAGDFDGLACSGDAPGLWDMDTMADTVAAEAQPLSKDLYRLGFVVQGERLGDVGGYVDLLLE